MHCTSDSQHVEQDSKFRITSYRMKGGRRDNGHAEKGGLVDRECDLDDSGKRRKKG